MIEVRDFVAVRHRDGTVEVAELQVCCTESGQAIDATVVGGVVLAEGSTLEFPAWFHGDDLL